MLLNGPFGNTNLSHRIGLTALTRLVAEDSRCNPAPRICAVPPRARGFGPGAGAIAPATRYTLRRTRCRVPRCWGSVLAVLMLRWACALIFVVLAACLGSPQSMLRRHIYAGELCAVGQERTGCAEPIRLAG